MKGRILCSSPIACSLKVRRFKLNSFMVFYFCIVEIRRFSLVQWCLACLWVCPTVGEFAESSGVEFGVTGGFGCGLVIAVIVCNVCLQCSSGT